MNKKQEPKEEREPAFLGYFYNSIDDFKAARPSRVGITDSKGEYMGTIWRDYRFSKLTPIRLADDENLQDYIDKELAPLVFDLREAMAHAVLKEEKKER